jgi:hypothetical protein
VDTSAAVAVAALADATPLRHAGPVIRDMLREEHFPAAGPDPTEAEAFTKVLRAVVAGGMQTGEFFTFFMRLVPAWEQHDELQRSLMVLLANWERRTNPEGTWAIAAALRGGRPRGCGRCQLTKD